MEAVAADPEPVTISTWMAVAAALAVPMFLLVLNGPAFWFKAKFSVHRVFGLTFLLQYSAAWFVFLTDYKSYAASAFPYTMSGTLLIQVISALYYFRFLPKIDAETSDPGMYSDKGVLPYDWVKENLFFALSITWGNIYYHDFGFNMLRSAGYAGLAMEILWVFFQFEAIRPLFPKTHLKNAFIYRSKTTTDSNVAFYNAMTWAGKIFYMMSKHMLGFFLQYARFVNGIDEAQLYWIRWWMLMNIGIHNIGTFVHTLRFKKMINPRLGFSIYLGYWFVSNYAILKLFSVYTSNSFIFLITFTGMLVNFCRNRWIRIAFQGAVATVLLRQRFFT